MTWRKRKTRRKKLVRDGVGFTCNGKGYTVRLGQKWKLTPHEVKSMNPQAAHHIEDYILI